MTAQQAPRPLSTTTPTPELLTLLRALGFEPSLYDHGRHIRKAKGFTHNLDHVHMYPDGRLHVGLSVDAETAMAILTLQAAGNALAEAAAALQSGRSK